MAPALAGTHVMLVGFLAAVALGVAAWAIARLLRAHAQLRQLREPGLAEMTLRAEAEALLAARLERGEIDREAHRRALLRLNGAVVAEDVSAIPSTTPPTSP